MVLNEQKTVLVVDDEEDVIQFLSMALEDGGFNVVTASNAFDALEKMEQTKPDLISLDLVMPKGSGVKLVREMKKKKEWATIPVLIVTGHARDDLGRTDLDELTMSGPGVYLEKPVKPKEYVRAVKRILHIDSDEVSPEKDEPILKDDLKNMIETADEKTLEQIKQLLQQKS